MVFPTKESYDKEIKVRRFINSKLSKRLARRSVFSQTSNGSADLLEKLQKVSVEKNSALIKEKLLLK